MSSGVALVGVARAADAAAAAKKNMHLGSKR